MLYFLLCMLVFALYLLLTINVPEPVVVQQETMSEAVGKSSARARKDLNSHSTHSFDHVLPRALLRSAFRCWSSHGHLHGQSRSEAETIYTNHSGYLLHGQCSYSYLVLRLDTLVSGC